MMNEARDEKQVPDPQDPGVPTRELHFHLMLHVSVQLELETEMAVIMENENHLLIFKS